MKKVLLNVAIFIIGIMLSVVCYAQTDFEITDITYIANEEITTDTTIKISNIDGENYLFLPSSADLSKMKLNFSGEDITVKLEKNSNILEIQSNVEFNFLSFYNQDSNDGVYTVNVIAQHLTDTPVSYQLNIMKSENIDSMFIVSSDPDTKGRTYIESDPNHELTANGMVTLLSENNSYLYDGKLKEIKGRGNSTWGCAKKPYQIKLKEKADLIQNGIQKNESKKWVLLANALDSTLLHNQITYDLGKELGMENSPDCKQIDLYYDGEYRGTYLLSEKAEIAENVMDIHDLEADFEEANDGIDFDSLSTAKATNKYGCEFQYVVGLETPENYSGGYLVEIDCQYYRDEKSWFTTGNGKYYVVKSPEYMSKEAMEYISNIFTEMDSCVKNNGINSQNGKKFSDYIDTDSLAKVIMINEWCKNSDGFLSSTYFYKQKDDDKIYLGSIWDFDGAYGIRLGSDLDNAENFLDRTEYKNLAEIKNKMFETYLDEIYPLIKNVLLKNNGEKKYLKSITKYVKEINASAKMNYKVWDFYTANYNKDLANYDAYIQDLKNFIKERSEWIKGQDDNYNINEPFYFDARYYSNKYPDLKSTFGYDSNSLYNHYINFGIKEGRQASSVFDPKYYLENYDDLNKAFSGSDKYILALNHFMTYGINEGREASEEFSLDSYKNNYEDLRNAFGNNNKLYYDHYINYGRSEGRNAEPKNEKIIKTDGMYFDSEYYSNKYPDLKAAFGDNGKKLYKHYITFGIKEGRQASPVFDPVYYLNNYEDLKNTFQGSEKYIYALNHFITFGINEGRSSSDEFDFNTYKSNYKDLRDAFGNNNKNYFNHYINFGKNEGRNATKK